MSAEKLQRVSAYMRVDHGPEHTRHEMWRRMALLMEWAYYQAADAEAEGRLASNHAMANIAPVYGLGVERAIDVADAYLKARSDQR